jgi:hypothetical protein
MWRVAILSALMTSFIRAQDSSNSVVVPVQFNHGRIILAARIGELGPFRFLLDSACTIPTLHPKLMDELKLEPSGRVRINGIAGEERAPTYRGVVFDFDSVQYSPRRVAVIPSERNERRRRDGVLDAGFFRRYVIELLPGENSIRLHNPTNYLYNGVGEAIPFRFHEEIPVIKASLKLSDKNFIEGELELDTGCDSGLCLGQSFVKTHDLIRQIEGRTGAKFGVGGSVETHMGRVPSLRIGKAEFTNVQTDFFLSGSPVDDPLAGHIGMSALGQRKVIFDYYRKRLIIE